MMKIKNLFLKIRESSEYRGFLAFRETVWERVAKGERPTEFEIVSFKKRINQIAGLVDKARHDFVDHLVRHSKPLDASSEEAWLKRKVAELEPMFRANFEKYLSEWWDDYMLFTKKIPEAERAAQRQRT